jgi:hypothetical protein
METVDEAVKVFGLKPKNECVTEKVKLVGSDAWSRNMFIGLVQRVSCIPSGDRSPYSAMYVC